MLTRSVLGVTIKLAFTHTALRSLCRGRLRAIAEPKNIPAGRITDTRCKVFQRPRPILSVRAGIVSSGPKRGRGWRRERTGNRCRHAYIDMSVQTRLMSSLCGKVQAADKGLRRLIPWLEADRRVLASLSNRFLKRDGRPLNMAPSNSITGLTGWKAPETATHGLRTRGMSELDTHSKAIGPGRCQYLT